MNQTAHPSTMKINKQDRASFNESSEMLFNEVESAGLNGFLCADSIRTIFDN